MFGFVAAFLVWVTPFLVTDAHAGIPIYYYALVLICYSLHQVCVYCMFVTCMAFFAKISDPLVGGTYMTLLNTVTNLGGNWPATLALWFVDNLTFKECIGGNSTITDNTCRDHLEEEVILVLGWEVITEFIIDVFKQLCTKNEGYCSTYLDGYYVETVVCAIIGTLWLSWARKHINYVQMLPDAAWKLTNKRNKQ